MGNIVLKKQESYRGCLAAPPSLLSFQKSMKYDQSDVAGEAQKHTGLQRNEEQFSRSAEVYGGCFGAIFLAFPGQWLAAGAELGWL